MSDLTNHLTGAPTEREFASAVANTPPGMAFTAGSGPKDKTCHGCTFWEHKETDYFSKDGKHGGEIKPATCAKYRRLTAGQMGAPIEHWSKACKYFEQNPTPPAFYKRK